MSGMLRLTRLLCWRAREKIGRLRSEKVTSRAAALAAEALLLARTAAAMLFALTTTLTPMPVQAESRANISAEEVFFISKPENPAHQNEERVKGEYDQRFYQRGKSRWSFRTHVNTQISSQAATNDEQFFFDPTNVYFEYADRNLYAQLGFFTLKWEGTDGVNPMDIASMKNWSDPLGSKTRASAGIHVGNSTDLVDWELAYIPLQTSSQLPGDDSAWWPRNNNLPLRTSDVELRLPDQVDYKVKPRGEMSDARRNNFALRLQTHRDFGDMALAYYQGAAQTPLVVPTLNVVPISVSPKVIYQLQSPIELVPSDYRVSSTAGFFSSTIGSTIIRASSRYDQPLGDVRNLTTWSQQTVAGFEHPIGANTVAILQGLWFHNPRGGSLVSIQDVFDKSVLMGLRIQPADTWTILFAAIQSTHDSSSFASVEVTKAFENGWGINAGAQSLQGPKNSLLGVLSKNDRATIEVTRAF